MTHPAQIRSRRSAGSFAALLCGFALAACSGGRAPAGGGDIEPDDWNDPGKEDSVCTQCTGGDLDDNALLLGVNRQSQLSDDFTPETILVPEGYRTKQVHLRAIAVGYFMQMADAAQDETGRRLRVGSGYRSFCTQCSLFGNYASNYGEEEANTFSARAGHSEHQLGTTSDIFNESGNFLGGIYDIPGTTNADPAIYLWLDANGWKYGFMNSYPPNDADNGDRFASRTYQYTEYIPEPWHWRFVGKRAAEVHHRLAETMGIRYSTHEFVDLIDGLVPDAPETEEIVRIMTEMEITRDDLEAEHPDDAAAIELATADMQCHSGTLGRNVHHGDCVQVTRAECGVANCAWWACIGGEWICATAGSCTATEYPHEMCEASEAP